MGLKGMNERLRSITMSARSTGYSMAIMDLADWAKAECESSQSSVIHGMDLAAFIRRSLDGRDERVQREP